jgi:CPA1 family monovalent cation:H+ antiporter
VENAQILIAGLLLSIALLGTVARWVRLPYPIVLVIGGTIFGFLPGVPDVTVNPDVVLLVFLPPLLYVAASFSNYSDIRGDTRAVASASIGLVIFTTAVVGVAAHELIAGLPWAAAFALGAIVAPTDPLAGAQLMRQYKVPRRFVAMVEGEGLFNDATALVAYRVAVVAVLTGSFSVADASLELVASVVAGIAIGFAVAIVIAAIRRRLNDSETSITISLLTGYAAYIPAHAIGASAVLATVTTGLYMGQRVAKDLDARTRLRGIYVWEILDFILNASLFVLIGLQLPAVLHQLSDISTRTLVTDAAAVCAAVILARFAFVSVTPYFVRMIDRRPQQRDRRVGWKPRSVVAWAGMRGSVSLAAALALPLTTDAGAPFPERDLLIFLTFAVIFATLVIQGLTLPAVIKWAGIAGTDDDEALDLLARSAATEAALNEIDRLETEDESRAETLERMRGMYRYRQRRLGARDGSIDAEEDFEARSLRYQQLVQSVLAAQRNELVRLRDDGEIPNDLMNRVLRELDLEEARLEI